ncbi:Predicted ATPase [Haloechinothrix alba]|uniref:Predicted ATPase n=1 Tax=Haloechinothrix alba TaxID=664784 RepID=A0A238VHX1_9PSEU|nr:LuxR C-terminal-related transcriptional regulator [Haloechinothrix alba]SNR33273.1 Predicted ATPase [Haloechinothrix alba]
MTSARREVGAGGPVELTTFVGRHREVAEIQQLLGERRLITLTGPGGVGKTRLAGHVLREVKPAFRDGVVFVGLAEVRGADLLANTVAGRLGLHDRSGRQATEAVFEYLRGRRLLLVLDNCEHLIGPCATFVRSLLAGCPHVSVLVTGRQSLGIDGERVVPIPPLSVSDDAVKLFVDRATAVSPTFRAAEGNEADLNRICRYLDGLPLAIELAAARIRSLSPRQIAARLTHQLPLLTTGKRTAPQRQQTLRATLDWSYQLCTVAECAVWAHASVFAGTFDLDAAEYVCSGPEVEDGVLDTIDALLDKSILLREDVDGHVRYRMLEPLREYGHERLEACGDVVRIGRLHRDWFDRLTEAADAEWASGHQIAWIQRLNAEHANVRAALGWSLAEPGEAAVAMRMSCRLEEYWASIRGLNAEMQLWLDRALAAVPTDHPERPQAVTVSALYSLWQTKLDDAERRLAQAAELAACVRDDVVDARIAYVRSFAWMGRVRPGTAELAAGAAATFAARGLIRRELHPLFINGVAAAYEGDADAGRRALERMIALCDDCGEVYFTGMAYFGLATVEVAFGDVDAAAEAAVTSLRCALETGARLSTAYRLDCLAWVADRQGDHERAARLFGAAANVWEATGSTPDVAVSLPHRKHLKATRRALGDSRFEAAYSTGRAMTEEETARYALGEETGVRTVVADTTCPLTPRQKEIADLVADGLTNREIATKLVITPRTADTHVQHILAKLDAGNRAQIATWVAGRRRRDRGHQ